MTELSRDSILLTRKYTRVHLGTLLDNYGAHLLVKMIPSVYIFYHERKLTHLPFSNKARIAGTRNMHNGRPLHHLNKCTGNLKSKYKGKELRKTLLSEFIFIETNEPCPKFNQKINLLQRNFRKIYKIKTLNAILIQKYMRRFHVKNCKMKAIQMINEGIDFESDIITTDSLVNPCIILPDYNNGNCVFYNQSTIGKMAKSNRIPIYSYFNELIQEEEFIYRYIIEKDVFGKILYKSPFTRIDFTMNDVLSLRNNLIFKFGQLITLFQNRMCCDKAI